jgi:(p)ppGpp synthase/HD superfamily hydrolase
MSESLLTRAEQLVASRIPGNRKGSQKPAYMHSFDVRNLLKAEGYSEEVCLAGLLHDVIEDSETTFKELEEMGYSPRVLKLVRYCTHDDAIDGNDARWVCMMAALVLGNDAEAWAIKIADILCNIGDSATMHPDRRHMLRFVKGKMLLSLTEKSMAETALWKRLEQECALAL